MAWTGTAAMLLAFTTTSFAQRTIYVTPVAAPSTTSEGPMPPTPPASTLNSNSTSTCTETICADYINTCGIWYGGCYPVCSNYSTPSYTNPGCPSGTFRSSFSKSVIRTTRTNSCGYSCDYKVDGCGNTYGPGCYTSCPGAEVPGYTIPVCEVTSTTTDAAVTTSEAFTTTSHLNEEFVTGTEVTPTPVNNPTGEARWKVIT